jgi:hypothetical protein
MINPLSLESSSSDMPPLSEFGMRLRSDKSGEVCAEYCDVLKQALAHDVERLRRPLETHEYETTKAMVESTTVALEVVQRIWEKMHRGS